MLEDLPLEGIQVDRLFGEIESRRIDALNERNSRIQLEKKITTYRECLGAAILYIIEHPDDDSVRHIELINRISDLLKR